MEESITLKDQMNRTVRLKKNPKRIVSLVPSQSELLYDLGLDEEVVGITKFCIHPEIFFRNKTRIGGTKKIDFQKIKALQPDLIIGNKEENTKEDIEQLEKEFPVWMSNIETLNDAIEMIFSIGQLVNKEEESARIIDEIKIEKSTYSKPEKLLKTLYLIWYNPIMAAGKNTFIDFMMYESGFENVCPENRYPQIDYEYIQQLNPEVVLLSSEPFPFKEKHIKEMKMLLPDAKILLVDGEMFSWYGSRLKYSYPYFKEIMHKLQ